MMSSLLGHRRMRRLLCLPSVLLMISLAFGTAHAQLSNYYTFGSSLGAYTSITGGNTVILNSNGATGVGVYNEDATAGPYNIGFGFLFNGITYSTFTLNARGFLVLGSTLNSNPNNAIENPPISDPIIAAFWDQQHMYDGSATCVPIPSVNVSYLVSGVSPNRILTVEWGTQLVSAGTYYYAGNCLPMCNYEVRLYECSNRIEYQYGAFRISTNTAVHSTASIGIASGPANFMSVTTGPVNTVSSVSPNNLVDNNNVLATTLIPIGQIFSFSHFTPDITGRTGVNDGGTAGMAIGDTLLIGKSAVFGNPSSFTPFSLSVPASGCAAARKYGLVVTGAAAADYYFGTPGTQFTTGSVAAGGSVVPPITFAPTAIGDRIATLTIVDSTNNVGRTYYLKAKGISRITFNGIVAQGGTAAMANNDTLFLNTFVVRGTSANFTPFTLTNVGTNGALPAAVITYTITGGGGQYSIAPPGSSLTNGQSTTPTMGFNAVGVGPQPALLTINADGEVRKYVLYATSAVPSAIFRVAGTALDSSSTLFTNHFTCDGESYDTYQIQVQNNGGVPFSIDKLEVWETDTVYQQGSPRYPLRRDQLGRLVPLKDYFLTLQPPVMPIKASTLPTYPIVVPTLPQFSSMYLTMISRRPGKRFGRIFLRTNCQNLAGPDTNTAIVTGLLRLDVFGRGQGSILSDNAGGGLPKTVTFPDTRIGDSATRLVEIVNPGVCDLRISLPTLSVQTGDVDDYSIVTAPDNVIDAATHDLLIGPGLRDTIVIRFKPRSTGSRRAGLHLQTNDSSVVVPGVSERGTYYLDLYGSGKGDLYATGADLGQALMGGDATEYRQGTVRLQNTRTAPVTVDSVRIVGADSVDFIPDAKAPAWPTQRVLVTPGQGFPLGVAFAPKAGGQPTLRNAAVRYYISGGEIVNASVTGLAGTRTIGVAPLTVNFGSLATSTVSRRTVTITNTGTMPLKLQAPFIPPGSDEFKLGQLPRLDLVPGQSEYLEVSYTSTTPIAQSVSFDIKSNATNGTQTVQLTGVATRAGGGKDDPTVSTTIGAGHGLVGSGIEQFSISGVTGVRDASGMALMQSVPNPGRDRVEILYELPRSSDATLELFDAQGRLVRVLDAGARDAGRHRVVVDVSDLASGSYHYRLTSGGVLIRTLVVEH